MKRIVVILLVFLAAVVSVPHAYAEQDVGQILNELNLARTEPARYAQFLKERRVYYKGNIYGTGEGMTFTTDEGVRAVDEAIAFLEKAKPVEPLMLSGRLSEAAMALVRSSGPTGNTGHNSAGGMTFDKRVAMYGMWKMCIGEDISYGPTVPREIVVQLIIDDGVKSRGHRTNIFNSDYKVAGIACGAHKDYGYMCVIDFAGSFKAK